MVWEMAYSHTIHKADSTAQPASALTNSVAYFSISKKGVGVRAKKKSPTSLLPGPCQGNVFTPHPFIKGCTLVWRTEEGVLMTGMEPPAPILLCTVLAGWGWVSQVGKVSK